MAIAFDAATTKTNAIVSSFNFSHTTGSGNQRFLIVSIVAQDSTSVSSVTYNGVSLTSSGARAYANFTFSEQWYLANPDSGANTVQVNLSGATAYPTATAKTYTGVAQTSPVDGTNTATANSTTPSVSVTTSVDNSWVVDSVGVRTDSGDTTLTVNGSQNQRSNFTSSSQERQGTSDEAKATAGSVSMDWTLASGKNWSITAMGIKEYVNTSEGSGTGAWLTA